VRSMQARSHLCFPSQSLHGDRESVAGAWGHTQHFAIVTTNGWQEEPLARSSLLGIVSRILARVGPPHGSRQMRSMRSQRTTSRARPSGLSSPRISPVPVPRCGEGSATADRAAAGRTVAGHE
jgi:hypothetical protein